MGRCWPGTVVFPDFFHPEIKFYWEKNLKNLYSYFNYSGIWLDMNEISNFCNGECLGFFFSFLFFLLCFKIFIDRKPKFFAGKI